MSGAELPIVRPDEKPDEPGERRRPGLARRLLKRALALLGLALTSPVWLTLLVFSRRAAIVRLSLKGALSEDRPASSWLRRRLLGEEGLTFLETLSVLEHIERDPWVEAVILDLDRASLSLVHADELASSIIRVRESGKKVLAWIDDAGGPALRLAAAADRLVGPPAGMLAFLGVRARFLLWKGGLERLGVVGEMEHVGPWKTASDAFTRRDLTPEHRAMLEEITKDLHRATVEPIAQARKIEPGELEAALAQAPIDHPGAVSRKLLDATRFRDELDDETRTLLGLEKDDPLPREASAARFVARARRRRKLAHALSERPRIALVPLNGAIVPGDELPGAGTGCASRSLAELLETLRETKDVAACVLRIDSPGGSAEASDEIWRAVARLDEECPVVASLGRVAASGGYYSACGARWIVAHPSSITGSIGVVTGKIHAAPLLDRLGIAAAEVATAPRAGMFEPDRPFSEEEREAVRREMFRVYETFKERVARARKKTTEEVDALGRGRVYTGRRAHEIGLVDELGGVTTAIARARTLLGLEPGDEHRLVSLRARPKRSAALSLPLGVLEALLPRELEGLLLLARERVLLWEPSSIEGA